MAGGSSAQSKDVTSWSQFWVSFLHSFPFGGSTGASSSFFSGTPVPFPLELEPIEKTNLQWFCKLLAREPVVLEAKISGLVRRTISMGYSSEAWQKNYISFCVQKTSFTSLSKILCRLYYLSLEALGCCCCVCVLKVWLSASQGHIEAAGNIASGSPKLSDTVRKMYSKFLAEKWQDQRFIRGQNIFPILFISKG